MDYVINDPTKTRKVVTINEDGITIHEPITITGDVTIAQPPGFWTEGPGREVIAQAVRATLEEVGIESLKKTSLFPSSNPPLIPDEIDWSHVHTNYNWMARDHNGEICIFDVEPECHPTDGVWYGGDCSEIDCIEHVSSKFQSYVRGTVDWKDSLVKRS